MVILCRVQSSVHDTSPGTVAEDTGGGVQKSGSFWCLGVKPQSLAAGKAKEKAEMPS